MPQTSAEGTSAPPLDRPRASRRGTLLRAGKLLLTLAVIALVASLVPWSDQVVWSVDGERYEVPGEMGRGWKDARVGFTVSSEFVVPETWPPLAREALRPGASVTLDDAHGVRSAEDEVLELGGTFEKKPGMPRVFSTLDPTGLVLAILSILAGALVCVVRWWWILALADCPMRLWAVTRLTFVGLFYNILLPGTTGGDLVKAALAVRDNPLRRANALVSIFVDRLIGLLALATLAAVMILVIGDELAALRIPVALFLAAGVAAALVHSSRAARRVLRFDWILERLPLAARVKKVDQALLLYSKAPLKLGSAYAISFVNHLFNVCAVFALARAFGDELPLVSHLAITPIANAVSSLPLTAGGWGFGEAAYGFLFALFGSSATIGMAASVALRLCTLFVGIVFGGAALLAPGGPEKTEVRGKGHPDPAKAGEHAERGAARNLPIGYDPS